jgi:Tfp pilus assembly protein PilF
LQQRVTWLAIFTAGIAAVLLPVALRNARTTGELVLTTSQFGPNFYIGNRLGAHGGYEPLVAGRGNAQFEREDAIRLAEAASGRPLTAGEVSDYWWQRTVGDIRQAPGSWIRLLARKTWLTFASREPIDTESLEAYRDSSVLLRALRFFDFGIVMALAVFGAWMTRDRWRRLSVLYATFAVMAASVIIFFVFARYRFPLVPVALLFAGAGLASAVGRPRGSRAWLPGAIAAAATVLLLHIPVQTSSDETYVNYGSELLREGRPAEAVPLLREAVRQDPSHGDARLSLALALQKTGQAQAAIDEFNTAARLDPRSSKAPAGVAITLHQQGRVQEAIPFYEDAIRLAPESIEALSNLGLALIELGRPAEAIVPLERAVALQPQDPRVRINLVQAEYALAQALAADGDAAGAILHMERALSAARAGGAAPEAARIEEALRLLRRGG